MKKEENIFAPYIGAFSLSAFVSSQTIGRRYSLEELDDDLPYLGALNPFFIDKEKIRLSKFLRRLDDKTQVFVDHHKYPSIRNRKSHTDEVVAIAVYIAKILGLNVGLVRAIALGHDIGHTPYGHIGERALSELAGRKFRHEIMGVVIVQFIERSGKGLNLSWEVVEGIKNHSRGVKGLEIDYSLPLEYAVVMLADKVAYTFSDLNDALCCGYFKESQLPTEFFTLGKNQRERLFNCIFSLVKESSEKQFVSFFDSPVALQFELLRQWSFENFYHKLDEEIQRENVYDRFKKVYPVLGDAFSKPGYDPILALALMTDSELKRIALTVEKDIKKAMSPDYFKDFSFFEIISSLPKNSKIDLFDPGLDKSKFFRFEAF